MVKLENETLLMKMDDDTDWFSVLYFPKSVEYYSMKLSLCRTIRSVFIQNVVERRAMARVSDANFNQLYDTKKWSNECACRSRNT
uniref:Transposase n=1 Tax=Caenorhabditis tropicalis TaxID=1561998 RepID=A0A1I7U089_9PELO